MERNLFTRAAEFISEQRKKKRWTKAVTAMAAVVVFCTTYALILPAITQETDVFCGHEAHSHGADCYGQVLTCDLPEAKAHVHSDGCYEVERTLVCTQEESAGHTHSDACRTETSSLTCTSEEEGHEHGEGCYTVTSSVTCGQEESTGHTHGDGCWKETRTLVCTESTEIPEGGHVHGPECYGGEELTCTKKEHEHELKCYSNPKADLESASVWERTLPDQLTGVWADDLLAVAETQLGYQESTRNYHVDEEGNKLGYTRYGDWYGSPYGHWCAMFVSFCLNYADIPTQAFPREASCQQWIEDLTDLDLYREAESYIPTPGDLIFFNWDEESDSDHVGLVEEVVLDEKGNCKEIKTIEGNSSNKVQRVTYDWGDPSIMGYGELPENPNPPAESEEEGAEETTQTEEVPVLSPEEQIKVNEVIAMIDALPDAAVAEETLLDYEAFEEWEGYEDYFRKVGQDGLLAYTAYEELTEEGKAQVTNYSKLQDLEWIWSMATLEETDTALEPGKYGNYIFSYNETRDAFIRDPAYADYYNENSPLGTAGSFHLVAFGTVDLRTHTNGNVLAHTLIANENFGTRNYPQELTYVLNYQKVNSGSASGTTDHILVVGSTNKVTLGDRIQVNGTSIDSPYQIVQDRDSDVAPFINLDRVEQEMLGISAQLAAFNQNVNVEYNFSDQNNRWIELTDPDGVGVLNMTATELQQYQNNELKLRGFQSGHSGTIVINVDCSNFTPGDTLYMPNGAIVYVDGNAQGTGETVNFSPGKVVWNFVNAEKITIVPKERMTGMVIALGATVDIHANLNGTVVAEHIIVNKESHRTDFTGSIVPPKEGTHIQLVKVDWGNISIRLPNAKFSLYKWDGVDYAPVTDTLVTNTDGLLEVGNLQYNTAYRLVETTAPSGYMLKSIPYDFLVSHADTTKYPVSKPSDFGGEIVSNGHIKYFRNEKQEEGNYILPETGGAGTNGYTFGGLLLMAGAGFLLYRKTRDGREAKTSS